MVQYKRNTAQYNAKVQHNTNMIKNINTIQYEYNTIQIEKIRFNTNEKYNTINIQYKYNTIQNKYDTNAINYKYNEIH